MFSSNIEGVEDLCLRIPVELQSWNNFPKILDLHYFADINNYGQEINCLDMVVSDKPKTYKITLHLYNVHGKVAFNTYNGFYSGWTIDDLSGKGHEKENRFHLYSYEMDIDPDIYCEKIAVE